MLKPQQQKVIHVARRALGLDDDVYRDILRTAAGVTSSKDLDARGFRSLMARFEELGFRGTRQARPRSRAVPGERDPEALVTGEQLRLLRHLFAELGFDTLLRQGAFCERVCKRRWPQTRAEASKVIEALKRMRSRGYDAGPRRDP